MINTICLLAERSQAKQTVTPAPASSAASSPQSRYSPEIISETKMILTCMQRNMANHSNAVFAVMTLKIEIAFNTIWKVEVATYIQ